MQEMTQEQLEEMMERQGQSQAQGGKELEISLEQQKGSSAQDSNQQCAPQAITPVCPYWHRLLEQLHEGLPPTKRSCQAKLKKSQVPGKSPCSAVRGGELFNLQ